MRFSKMQKVSHCYTAVLYEPISKLHKYKNPAYIFPMLGLRFFCNVQELRNLTTTHYENTPIQIYRQFHLQELKTFR